MSVQPASHPSGKRPTTVYEEYLRTDELLSLQTPQGERLHPDQLTFQVVHQTFELWWKATVEQLQTSAHLLEEGHTQDAARSLRRAVSAQSVVLTALRQLEFVAPADFLKIRRGLGAGSGAESPGFRAILRKAPDVWEAFTVAMAHEHVALVDLYAQPHEHLSLYECAEALTDFDEQFHLFRAAHLKLAQRHLGLHATGTGGTPMQALERTLHDLLFPQLWEARDALLQRAEDEGGPYGTAGGQGRATGHSS